MMERLIGMGTRGRIHDGLMVGVIAFVVGLAIGATLITASQGQPVWLWISRFAQNTLAAVAGALITLVLIERVLLRRMIRDSEILTDELIGTLRETGSEAVEAADLLAVSGQFRSGSMRGANLIGAQLAGRNLSRADFRGTKLRAASLRGADLRKAQLQHADLSLADLRRANLSGASLEETRVWMAYLHGANLSKARIGNRALSEAFSLRAAILPDGSRYDGRFGLAGDLEAAAEAGIDVQDAAALGTWYATCTADDPLPVQNA